MKVTWLGHAAFLIEGEDRILVDPFLRGNPMASVAPGEVECDMICVTHAHSDHFGDAVEISKRNGAPILAIFEVATVAQGRGAEVIGMNIGGSKAVGDSRITMTDAVHSSCFVGDGKVEAGGSPAGFIVESGGTVYHSGDTAVFGDMALIGELYEPDLSLLPIGDFYTMGIRQATKAVELLGTPLVIPMHYNTFDVIRQDPALFAESVSGKTKGRAVVLEPGQSHSLG